MVVSINIDETIRKPNVRPPAPRSKRGPITFIAEIQESNGRDLYRNLTRGVNATDDTPSATPIPGDRVAALGSLILSLSVSSEFIYPQGISLPSVVIDFTLPDVEILAPDRLDLSTISVELINLIDLNNGLTVTDDEFLALTLPEAAFAIPENTDVSLSSLIVNLTPQSVETLTTGSQFKALSNLITILSSNAAVECVVDSDTSSVFTDEIEVQAFVNAEVASVDLNVEEFEIEAGGDLDIPGINLTLDIETEDEAFAQLEAIVIDLTLDIAIEADSFKQLEAITLELSDELQIGIGMAPLSITAEVIESAFEVGGNVIPISNDLELDDFQLNSDVITSSLTADLVAEFIALQVGGDIDAVDVDLSLITASDAELNIQLPANMEAAQADDPTTVT